MIYITGDTHGEMSRFDAPQLRRLKKGDTLLICGDFGYLWDGGKKEAANLKKLGRKKYQILFIDGTHENFNLLNEYPVETIYGGKAQHISGNIYHLMRGQIYEIEGCRFFAFGGGESDDKQMYVDAGKWWEQEMPTLEEMREAVTNLNRVNFKVDYVVTHEPAPGMMAQRVNPRRRINQLEAFFEELAKRLEYRKWFFGSLHIDRKVTARSYAMFSQVIPVEQEGK